MHSSLLIYRSVAKLPLASLVQARKEGRDWLADPAKSQSILSHDLHVHSWLPIVPHVVRTCTSVLMGFITGGGGVDCLVCVPNQKPAIAHIYHIR